MGSPVIQQSLKHEYGFQEDGKNVTMADRFGRITRL